MYFYVRLCGIGKLCDLLKLVNWFMTFFLKVNNLKNNLTPLDII